MINLPTYRTGNRVRRISVAFALICFLATSAPSALEITPIDTLTIAANAVVYDLAFSPDDSRLVAGTSDGYATVWRTTDGSIEQALGDGGAGISSVAFAPDGAQVITGDRDGAIQTWRIDTGALTSTILTGAEIFDLALSPDGGYVAVANTVSRLSIWNLETGEETLLGSHSPASSVTWSDDGRYVLWDTRDDGIVVYSYEYGTHRTIQSAPAAYRYPRTLRITSDGRYVIGTDSVAALWDFASGERIREYRRGEYAPESIALSRNGRTLVAAGRLHGFAVWDVDTGDLLSEWDLDGTASWHVALSHDGDLIALGGGETVTLYGVTPPLMPEGGIDGEVTGVWHRTESPIRIRGDVVVPAGETLRIESGVDVLFDVDSRFVVHGRLIAEGTETDSVRFIPGTAREWGGINFVDGGESSMSYVRVSGARVETTSQWAGEGGGVSVQGDATRLDLAHCVISGNRADFGGGIAFVDASGSLRACTIRDNTALFGGGVSIARSDVTLDSCTVVANRSEHTGGGMRAVRSTVALRSCEIVANESAGSAGLFFENSDVCAEYTLFAHNRSTGVGAAISGAAHSGLAASLRLTNCTIAENGIEHDESATVRLIDTDFSVTNSILWDNPPYRLEGGSVAIGYSNVRAPVPDGPGNFSADPLFVDTADGDFRLTEYSPCIDAGDPESPYDDDGTRADVGAYPRHQDPPNSVSAVGTPPAAFALWQNAPNPFNPRTTLRFSIPKAGAVRIAVYDVNGRLIRKLLNERRVAGSYEVTWDSRDDSGRAVGSGVYLCQLRSGDRVATLRITLVR